MGKETSLLDWGGGGCVCVCVCVGVCVFVARCVQLFATPWTITYQPPLSMGVFR